MHSTRLIAIVTNVVGNIRVISYLKTKPFTAYISVQLHKGSGNELRIRHNERVDRTPYVDCSMKIEILHA